MRPDTQNHSERRRPRPSQEAAAITAAVLGGAVLATAPFVIGAGPALTLASVVAGAALCAAAMGMSLASAALRASVVLARPGAPRADD